ncbi:MAG TPA: 4Fe-4S binding protein, partial [Verrucomicrobiota bacterium]|nr:4Fe-4S binding protein [Verrucomicrobiota bacterium]
MGELTRREFLKIATTTSLAMPLVVSSCRRPEEKIVSLAKPFGDVKPGQTVYYATAMPSRMSALPLIVKNVDYHPVKIEGNPLYPKGGGTNRFAQASLFSLYDPLRSSRFLKRANERMVDTVADDVWRVIHETERELENGAGLCILTGQTSSPSFERLIAGIIEKYPQTKWFVYEPIDLDYPNYAASKIFGDDVCILYDLSKANVIVSLDCDFLDSEEDAIFNARDFISTRDPIEMSRLYSIEAGCSLTGAYSDNRLAVSSNLVQAIIAGIAYRIFSAKKIFDDNVLKKLRELSAPASKYNNSINIFVKDLLSAQQSGDKKPIVMAGYRQPLIVQALAIAINFALNSVGKTVVIKKRNRLKPSGSIYDLATLLKQDAVKTLVISGTNPIYDAPVNLDWKQVQRKAQRIIRLGLYEDETTAESDIHIPLKHFLECWGDARNLNGTLLSIQPVIQPVWSGVSEIEFFSRLLGNKDNSDYDIARHTSNFKNEDWNKFVRNGFLPNSEWKDFSEKYDNDAFRKIIDSVKVVPQSSEIEINYYRSFAVDDGRYFTNVWLQETPDPITKVVWDNPALISPNTAKRLGISDNNGVVQTVAEVIEIQLKGRSVRCPVVIQPGMADDVVALTLGYGRRINSDFGKMNFEIGFNAFKLRDGDNPYFEIGAELKIVNGSYEHIARVQPDSKNPDEDIIIESDLLKYKAEPNFVKKILENSNKKKPAIKKGERLYKSPELNGNHQWGMVIDLNKCIGCGVCMLACRSEN